MEKDSRIDIDKKRIFEPRIVCKTGVFKTALINFQENVLLQIL